MTITENGSATTSRNDETRPAITASRGEAAVCDGTQRDGRVAFARTSQVSPGEPEICRDEFAGDRAEGKTSLRPTWLPDGCPPWCSWQDCHQEHDHYDDRIHTGGCTSVVMTVAHDLNLYIPADDPQPSTLDASLYQHFREVAPHVEITRDGRATDLQLTLDEAEDFAGQVLRLVATGRAGQSAAYSAADCPAWCSEHVEDNHISADRRSGPFLVRLHGAEEVVVDLIRDARRDDDDRPLTAAEAEKLGIALLELAAAAQGAPGKATNLQGTASPARP